MMDKNVLITGGTSGMGLAVAELMFKEGANVAVTGLTDKNLEHTRSLLPEVMVLRSDSGNVSDQNKLADQLRSEFGHLDSVIINAGISTWLATTDWNESEFDRLMSVNFKGPFFLLQSLKPILANPASIVFTISVAAHRGLMHTQVYGASKAALLALMRSLTTEWAQDGIRLNSISPGGIDTPILDKLGADSDKIREHFSSLIPAKRFGTSEEIANTVLFLASEESSYIYGSDLPIDGGFLSTFPS
jgi:NAD(P)-dependent dehydrogenase (short-subunit alcohol dehydrogenase family)